MTNPDLTQIVFVLDRSGSMQTIKEATETAFGVFIGEQRAAAGQCRVTLAQFDTEYEVVYANERLEDVPPLNLAPRGGTALYDAIGKAVTDTGVQLAALPEDDRPGTVIVAIITDGEENSSREWNQAGVKSIVETQISRYNWQFLYLGANQDAVMEGSKIGIRAEYAMTYSAKNVGRAMAATSANVAGLRNARITEPGAAMDGYSEDQRNSVR